MTACLPLWLTLPAATVLAGLALLGLAYLLMVYGGAE